MANLPKRLAPAFEDLPKAAAVLAAEVPVRHMAHRPREDPERLAEKPQAEHKALHRMGSQMSPACPLQIQSRVEVEPIEAPKICSRLVKIAQPRRHIHHGAPLDRSGAV